MTVREKPWKILENHSAELAIGLLFEPIGQVAHEGNTHEIQHIFHGGSCGGGVDVANRRVRAASRRPS